MVAPLAIAGPRARMSGSAGGRPPVTTDPLERLLGIGVTISIRAGQTIVLEGDPLSHCYRVISGTVRLYKAVPDGRRQVIAFVDAGEVFGLLGRERFAYTAEAVGPASLSRHPRRTLKALGHDPELAASLIDLANLELERAHAQMLLLGRKSAEEKVASFLMTCAARSTERSRGEQTIHLSMSRQDMADYLGLTIETVSRTFGQLKRQGLISLLTPQHVALLETGPLMSLADGQ